MGKKRLTNFRGNRGRKPAGDRALGEEAKRPRESAACGSKAEFLKWEVTERK